jgi:hypothetical protein
VNARQTDKPTLLGSVREVRRQEKNYCPETRKRDLGIIVYLSRDS